MPDTIRCPMCGKTNPANAAVCQYCNAHLKPVIANEPPAPAPENDMDWLRNLAASHEPGPESESYPSPADAEDKVEDSFLLDRLRSSGFMPDEPPSPPASEPPPPAPLDREEEGNAEWLNILEESSARKEKAQHALPPDNTPDLDSWLDELDQKGPEQGHPEGLDVPDSQQKSPQKKITGRLKEEGSAAEADSHDWLNSLRAGTPPEKEPFRSQEPVEESPPPSPPPFIAPSDDDSDLPDWLQQATPFSTGTPAEEAPEAIAPADLPDWLQEQPAPPSSSAVEPALGADLPDWLKEIAPDLPAAGMAAEEELPAWLKDETTRDSAERMDFGAFSGAGSDDLADLLSGTGPTEEPSPFSEPLEPPAQFSDEKQPDLPVSPFTEVPPEASAPLPFLDRDLPDWTKTDPEEEPAWDERPFTDLTPDLAAETQGTDSIHPFAADNLPDWLENKEEVSDFLPEESPEALKPAQLPGWLAAMRPVEAVAPESPATLNERIEKSGPLAGLRGILPAERLTTQYRKPPLYSAQLQTTETQTAHAELLENLIQAENKPRQAKRQNTQGSKRLMQLVVALVLIAVLLTFRTAGNTIVSPTRPYLNPFILPFAEQIENLPANTPVLLAVDYEPGYTGELKAISSVVLQRLMHNQQRLAAISTVPAGPILAEDLLQSAYTRQQADNPGYSLNTSTINLGYLPGGITSLKEFALRPQQAARYGLTSTHDGLLPWNHPALTDVTRLTDFGLVIVITDSVDTGRAWVEQIQPALGSTPLLLISSAQAAPMLEPYVQSGQVSGMLSGLAGSVAYENTLQQPGLGQSYWIAFQSGLAVIIALILVGILLQLFVILFARRKPPEA